MADDSLDVIPEIRDINVSSTFVVFFADASTYGIVNESAKFYKS
jgi:hypothetical protein